MARRQSTLQAFVLALRAFLLLAGVVLVASGADDREGQPAPAGTPSLEAQGKALDVEGRQLYQQGKFAQAAEMFQQALAIRRKLYPPDQYPLGHPDLAEGLNNLGELLRAAGEYEPARDYLVQALTMYEALYPKAKYPDGHPHLATCLNNLGLLLHSAGDYEPARGYHERALAMYEALYPKAKYPDGHPQLAMSLTNLGALWHSAGEYELARGYLEQGLAMRQALYPKAKFPAGHFYLANSLTNLGRLLRSAGEHEQARPYLEQALAMNQALYPKAKYPDGHLTIATSLSDLGSLQHAAAQNAPARDYFEQALGMYEALYPRARYPDGHPHVAACLNNLGLALDAAGRYDEARRYYEQAEAMYRDLYPDAQFPDGHPYRATSLTNLGGCLHAAGQPADALGYLKRAVAMNDALGERYATLAAEAQALRFLRSLPRARDSYLSAATAARTPAAEVYAGLWHSRGLLTRLLTRRHQATRVALQGNAEARKAWAELLDVRHQLSRLLLAPGSDPAVRAKELKRLTERKEALERDLAQLLPELERTRDLRRLGPTDLAACLPAGSVFIDFLRYRHREKGPEATDRYLAFAVRPDRAVTLVELGGAEPIDRAIRAWRDRIAKGQDAPADAQQVAAQVWEPLAKQVPAGTSVIYLAPDGELARLPWAALPGAKPGAVLLDDVAVAQVPHGPFLLEQLKHPPAYPAGPEVVLGLGDIDYGPAEAPAYPPLKGTAAELAKLGELAGLSAGREVALLRQGEARWDKLKELLPKARYAHLATHGFFDQQAIALEEKRHQAQLKQGAVTAGEAGLGVRSPLSFTGLVLAGANRPGCGEAVVTGEGLVGLPLEGLRLCVLSACESGLGDLGPLSGEGVQGLPRALHLAGCANVVSSLWRVDDAATAALMAKLYDGLWRQGKAPAEALRQAQLTVYRHPDWVAALADRGPTALKKIQLPAETAPETGKTAPTRLWAAFVLSGAGR
jgi:CHAT domain-containing protein/Tfp pilus assembly protein PilF